jgi:hypothetical protein
LQPGNAVEPTEEIRDPNIHGSLTSLIAVSAITPLEASKAELRALVLAIRMFDTNGMTNSYTIIWELSCAAITGVKFVDDEQWRKENISTQMKLPRFIRIEKTAC